MANTAERIVEIMNERDLRQADILRLCEPYSAKYGVKMNKSDISQYISGRNKPGQFKLTILSLALNVSEGWLMGIEGAQKERSNQSPMLVDMQGIDKLLNDIEANNNSFDPIDYEIVDLILSLSPEKKQAALSYLQFLSKN